MRVFILGANDPEMREIVRVLADAGEMFVYAQRRGRPVLSSTAYDADGVSSPLTKGADVIFVECAVQGLTPAAIVDHHRPGDPGYDCAPAQYLDGSSLGQVLTLLGKEPSELQRIICAADHCPGQAYRGECPGVEPQALAKWRVEAKAALKRIAPEAFEALVTKQYEQLKSAERIEVGGLMVAWLPEATDETPEASARYNIPFMYTKQERDGRKKVGILGAPPEIVATWMRECDLANVYGNPSRGYAGGYVE